GPASRVPLALLGLLRDARPPGDADGPDPGGALARQAAAPAALFEGTTGATVAPAVLGRGAAAWAQLVWLISFEMFGQCVGSFDPADDLFEYAVTQLAGLAGL